MRAKRAGQVVAGRRWGTARFACCRFLRSLFLPLLLAMDGSKVSAGEDMVKHEYHEGQKREAI